MKYRWADGNPKRFAELAADLVRLNVDIIATWGRTDREIAERVDDIAWYLWQRVALAVHSGNTEFIERYGWKMEAFARLHHDERGVHFDA